MTNDVAYPCTDSTALRTNPLEPGATQVTVPFANGLFSYAESPPGLFVIAFMYLLLPGVAVLFRFQSWYFAAPVLLAAAATLYWLATFMRTAPGGPFWPTWRSWPFIVVAACAAMMTGVLPPFAQNNDWAKHYALFNTLATQPWPPAVPTADGFATLRYSLGYYIVPSIVAKYAGLHLLGAAIFLWTTLGLYLTLMLAFGVRGLSIASRFILCIVFLLFSGADIVGEWITKTPPVLPMHFEWWAKLGQISSNMTSMIWTPQHSLSAWIATFLLLRYPKHAVRAGGVLGAAVAVWSPFSAVGVVPIFVWAVWRVGPRHLLTWMNFVAAPVLLIAAAVFLTKGTTGIPMGFMWNNPHFTVGLWLLFVLLEFIAIALSLLLVQPRNAALIVTSVAALLMLSLTNVGAYGDLMMRGSVPALALLAAMAAVAITGASNTLRKAPLIICLVAGLVTPMGEIMRGFTAKRFDAPGKFFIPDIIGGRDSALAPQYLVPGYDGALTRTAVFSLETTPLATYGTGQFDLARHRIASDDFVEAALVSQVLSLAPGLYEIEAVADWDLTAAPDSSHAAHISLHGQYMVIQIPASRAKNGRLHGFFRTSGGPTLISFGLGGWGRGKGNIEFKKLTVDKITY